MHLQEKCLLFKSPNCFAIYDKIYNLSPLGPDGPCRCHIGSDDKYPRPAPGLYLYARLSGGQPPDLSPASLQRPCKTIIGCSYCHVIQYTMFQIYYVTMWTISMDCEGCLVNISGCGVFPNSVGLQSVAPPPPLHCDQTKRSPTTVLGSIIFLSKFK